MNVLSYLVEEIERVFDVFFVKIYEFMFKIFFKCLRDFFRFMMEEWDVRNIVNVVKVKLVNEFVLDYIIEFGLMFLKVKVMVEVKILEEIFVIFEGIFYEGLY